MTKSERITKSLDNARTAAEEALNAGAQGRVERNLHLAIVNLADAVEALNGGGEKAADKPASDAAPAKKAPAKKAPAKKSTGGK